MSKYEIIGKYLLHINLAIFREFSQLAPLNQFDLFSVLVL